MTMAELFLVIFYQNCECQKKEEARCIVKICILQMCCLPEFGSPFVLESFPSVWFSFGLWAVHL